MLNLRSPFGNVWKRSRLFFPLDVGCVVESGFRTRICLCRSRTLAEKRLVGERGLRATSFGENGETGGKDDNGAHVIIANIFSAKEDFEEVIDSDEDIHVSEVESDYEDVGAPSPPPPPPPVEIEEEEEVAEEEEGGGGEDEEDLEEEERQPSAKSITEGHRVPHRER